LRQALVIRRDFFINLLCSFNIFDIGKKKRVLTRLDALHPLGGELLRNNLLLFFVISAFYCGQLLFLGINERLEKPELHPLPLPSRER